MKEYLIFLICMFAMLAPICDCISIHIVEKHPKISWALYKFAIAALLCGVLCAITLAAFSIELGG